MVSSCLGGAALMPTTFDLKFFKSVHGQIEAVINFLLKMFTQIAFIYFDRRLQRPEVEVVNHSARELKNFPFSCS